MMLLTSLILTFASLQAAPAPQMPVKDSLPGAINVTRVGPTLLCGGATGAEAFPELRKRGFVSVINLRRDDEQGADIAANTAAATAAGLKFIHIPVARTGPDDATVKAFLDAVTDDANQPMYIHCASANRVGAFWLIKRVMVDGWDVDRATAEAKAIGLTSDDLRARAVEYATTHKR
jgi:uncharacterized protein (TIGR01244 family)